MDGIEGPADKISNFGIIGETKESNATFGQRRMVQTAEIVNSSLRPFIQLNSEEILKAETAFEESKTYDMAEQRDIEIRKPGKNKPDELTKTNTKTDRVASPNLKRKAQHMPAAHDELPPAKKPKRA
ncbi:MAG TPA: hypothetical protein VLF94_06675 [Chlamydiales bacterium]|nr:hypothetical protein [Chlamydiales bacterium]